jgi:glycosyltransferase involved in cell wall biosynthesis
VSETPSRPRVLFVITSRGKGTGGHHFSLRDLTARLRAEADVHIATVAIRFPPSLADVPDVTFIPWSPDRLAGVLADLLGLVRRFAPTHLHSYDPSALQLARVLSLWTRLPLIHTQCGGPTPRRNVPRAPDVVLFSEENRSGLAAHPRMADCRLHLIASRVNPVALDAPRALALRRHIGWQPGDRVVLRINRLVREYRPAMDQALALGALWRDVGARVHVVLLGSVGDEDLVRELESLAGRTPDVHVVTTPEFTTQAAALLGAADAVVGTGRGLMEAAFAGRVVFAPVAGHALPALLAPDTVDALAHANFSPRARLGEAFSDDVLASRAREALATEASRAASGAYARSLYEERFDASVAARKHLAIYAEARPWPWAAAPEAVADLGLNVLLEALRRVRRALVGGR